MKKLLLLTLAVAALAIAWWRSTDARAPASRPRAREIEFVALPPAAPDASSPGAPVASSPALRSRVRGRCVDSRGRPLAGVELQCAYPPARALSDASGHFELELDASDPAPLRAAIRATRQGLGVVCATVELDAGASTSLVDWVMAPAAILRGFVRDGAGQPLAGLEVRCTAGEFTCAGACATPRGPSLCATLTDERGAFEILDAPAGSLCVWAGAYGRTLWVSSKALDVLAGAQIDGLELVASRVARENVLGVRVLDPRGQPVAGARIDFRFHDRTRGGSGRGEADESGRWILGDAERAPHVVLARDPRGRWQPTHLAAVRPGAIDVPLVLRAPRRVELRVRDSSGAPVTSYGLELREASADEIAPGVGVDRLLLVDEDERPRPGGRTLLDAPSCPFTLELHAAGAIPVSAGPYDADELGGGLELTLSRPPGVTGQIRASGAGLAGATVSLHAATPEAQSARYGAALATATSDANGAFELPCDGDGTYWVRASAPQLAPSDVGPLEVLSFLGSTGNFIELSPGGSIEGVAPPAHGEVAEGVIITARRGDGFDRSTRTDGRGAFRLELLTPGPWLLERSPPAAGSPYAGAPQASVLCNVVALLATAVELPAPDSEFARLRGSLALGGEPAAHWRVELEGAAAQCDASGEFELTALLPGARRVVLSAPASASASWRLEGELYLREGLNEWRLDQSVGRIQGRARAGAQAAGAKLHWRWPGDGGWSASGALQVDAGGAFQLHAAPAGRLELKLADGAGVTLMLDATTTVDVEL